MRRTGQFRLRRGAAAGLAAVGIAGLAGPAQATWSILLVDVRTGEIALGSATCLTGFDLQANTPVLITGVGGATAQSFVDSTGQNRAYIRDQIALGVDPQEILDLLAVFDTGHQTRQYGMVDAQGRAATFSGTGASQWKGGQTGRTGDIVYAVQGNILTGEPVVTEAVQAIIETPGDLAEKMMASMEAARAMGGDGRCSCPGSPTSCGSPPASFTKSAHIAYMLIARAGDTDGSNGLYRASGRPWMTAAGDFDGDGMIDIASISLDSADASLYFNQTPAHSTLSIFTQWKSTPAGGPGREIVAADATGDGVLDLLVGNDALSQVSILEGDGAGGFGPPQSFATGEQPRRIVVADLDGLRGPDIAVAGVGAGGSVTVLLADGAGGFASTMIPAGGGIGDLVACDIEGDGDMDLVYPASSAGQLVVLRNTGGAFAIDQFVGVTNEPERVRAADFDGNGEIDFAVVTADAAEMAILLQDGGVFDRQVVALPGEPRELALGQFAGGPSLDIAVTMVGIAADLALLEGAPDGSFTLAQSTQMRLAPNRPEAADLNGDGLDDIAVVSRRGIAVATVDNHGGGFTDGQGSATGDYWMTFNVANSAFGDPEPVFTLRDMFDDWRTDLAGRPDAVQSAWTLEPRVVPTSGGHTATLRFTLADWRGMDVTVPVGTPVVRHARASAGLSSIGAVVPAAPGAWEVEIISGVGAGLDIFDVIIDDGVRPVTLMPAPQLLHGCAADCDGSGTLDFFDFLCFQNLFAAGDPAADCDGSGTLDFFDFLCFQNAFAAGCP